jgi:hypothetical protein
MWKLYMKTIVSARDFLLSGSIRLSSLWKLQRAAAASFVLTSANACMGALAIWPANKDCTRSDGNLAEPLWHLANLIMFWKQRNVDDVDWPFSFSPNQLQIPKSTPDSSLTTGLRLQLPD